MLFSFGSLLVWASICVSFALWWPAVFWGSIHPSLGSWSSSLSCMLFGDWCWDSGRRFRKKFEAPIHTPLWSSFPVLQITGSNNECNFGFTRFFSTFFFLNVHVRTWFLICSNFLLLFFLQRTYMVSDFFSNSLLLFFLKRTYVHVDFVIVPLPRIDTFGYFFSCETGKVSRKQRENFWYATVCF